MNVLAHSDMLILLAVLFTVVDAVQSECFSCVSNPNWSYYQDRIPGLKQSNATTLPPTAPLACPFDPMRIYADKTAVACAGYCIKWTGATILPDGGLEVNVLRGCFDSLIDSKQHSPPHETKCYQDPHDFNHKVGVEYKSTCYCKGFMCNYSSTIFIHFSLIALLFFRLY